MSKTINLLNNVEKERVLKYSAKASKVRISWIICIAALIFAIGVLGFNLKIYLMLKEYAYQESDTLSELNLIKEKMNDNARQLEVIEVTNSKIKDIYVSIRKLRDILDAQAFTAENLAKAKNTLFNRVSALEIQLDNINTTLNEKSIE